MGLAEVGGRKAEVGLRSRKKKKNQHTKAQPRNCNSTLQKQTCKLKLTMRSYTTIQLFLSNLHISLHLYD